MAFNGSGTFTLVSGNPVVSGTVISATTHNNTMSDIANNGLSNCITKDGQTTIATNIPFNSKRITGLGAATATTDAARADSVQNQSYTTLTSVAGTDTITATATPIPSTYAEGQIFYFDPANDNTGATTINISALGAKNIYLDGAALSGGELVAGEATAIRYNGTEFDIIAGVTAIKNVAKTDAANTFTATQRIVSADAGAGAGPDFELYRNSASPADDDLAGRVLFIGEDDGGNETNYAALVAKILDVTDTEEDGQLNLYKMVAGSLTDFGKLMSDYAQTWETAQRGEVTPLTSTSNSIAVDLAASNNFSHTLSENTTLAAPSNAVEGQSGVITFTQDAATARTLAYNTFWDFGGGSVPAVSTTLSSVNTFVYSVNAGGASATCNLIVDVS